MDDQQESPGVLPDDRRLADDRIAPSRTDPIVAPASTAIGGPVGLHAAVGRSRYWTPVRVIFLLALVALALSWFGRSPCLQQKRLAGSPGQSQLNWNNQRQYYSLCYSDVIALYGAEKLTPADLRAGAFPYRTYWFDTESDGSKTKRYMEYPVLTGMFMYVVAQATAGWQDLAERLPLPTALDSVMFFNLSALLLSLFWLIAVWATMMVDRRRIWVGALMALSPLLVLHAFTNFDTIAIAMLALAMLCWARNRPWLAGVFLGLGIAAKLYPLLLLVALLVLCLRDRRMQKFVATLNATLITWLAVNLPVFITYPAGWREFFRLNRDRGADLDSLYRLGERLAGTQLNTTVLNVVSALLLIAVIGGVAWFGLKVRRTPTVAQLMFLLVSGFLLVNKVWSPQYSLWLVPLAVLAIPRTRLLIGWMVIDALVWVPRMGFFLDADRKWLPDEWFYVAVVLRAAIVIVLCGTIVWDLVKPERADTEPLPVLTPDARMPVRSG